MPKRIVNGRVEKTPLRKTSILNLNCVFVHESQKFAIKDQTGGKKSKLNEYIL